MDIAKASLISLCMAVFAFVANPAEDPPPSPVPVSAVQGRVEDIELVPLAFTQLRITLFPWTLRRGLQR